MTTLYSAIFNQVFNSCGSYIVKDFSEIKGLQNRNQSNLDKLSPLYDFCEGTIRKIIDEVILVLDKSKYNGSLVVNDEMFLDREVKVNVDNCIKTTLAFKKKKISVNEKNEIRSINAKEEKGVKSRFVLYPIDGLLAFVNGISGFMLVLGYQEYNSDTDKFETRTVQCYDPILQDVYSFSKQDGFYFNCKRLTKDAVLSEKNIDAVYVNDNLGNINFNITKLANASRSFFMLQSSFYALCLLNSTSINLVIFQKNSKIHSELDLFDFCTNSSSVEKTERQGLNILGSKGSFNLLKL